MVCISSIGTAAVLSHYGVISGTATVTEPTFYLTNGTDLVTDEPAVVNLPDASETYTYDFDSATSWYAFNATLDTTTSVDTFNITSSIRDETNVTCSSNECSVKSDVTMDSLTFEIEFTDDTTETNPAIKIEKISGETQ